MAEMDLLDLMLYLVFHSKLDYKSPHAVEHLKVFTETFKTRLLT